MARLRRIVLPGELHVIVHRGHNGQPVFLDEQDGAAYLVGLREAAREAGVAVHAYGLLTREVRLLVTPNHATGLGRMMKSVGLRYVRAFNQRYARNGTPWEGRFRSAPIEAQPYLLPAMVFVEGLAAAEVAGAQSEPLRSSAEHHLAGRDDGLVEAHPAFWALGNTPFEREAAYRRFVGNGAATNQVAAILHAAAHGWVLGSDAFLLRAESLAQRRSRPSAAGRPRQRAD